MRVLPLTPEREQEWDDFTSRSDDAWLFHRSEWVRIESALDPSVSFLVESDGAIAGIFPLYVGRRQYARFFHARVMHTGQARSGPALAPELSKKTRRTVYQQMFAQVEEIASKHRIDRLEIRLPSLAPNLLPPLRPNVSPLSPFGPFTPLKYGHSLEQAMLVDQLVSLEPPTETLWMGLDDDCRKAVRKAGKSGIAVTRAASRSDVADYHRLHVETYQQTGSGTLPLEHFLSLWDSLWPQGFLQLLFAEHDGRRIAGLLLLCYRRAATYWAGSSEQSFLHLRPNNLLMWESMLWAKEHGCRWFELGPTFAFADPETKARRIGRFKEQFGGESFYLYEGARSYRPVKIAVLEILDAIAADCARTVLKSRSHGRGSQ